MLDHEVVNPSFPSLNHHLHKTVKMSVFTKRRIPFKRCCFNLKNKYDPKTYKELLGKPFYYGLPLMRECYLLAIVTPSALISNFSAQELRYEYNRKQHTQFYTEFLNDYGSFYYEDYVNLIMAPLSQSILNFRRDSIWKEQKSILQSLNILTSIESILMEVWFQ